MNNQSNSSDKKIKKEYFIITLYKKGRIFILQTNDFCKILEKTQINVTPHASEILWGWYCEDVNTSQS